MRVMRHALFAAVLFAELLVAAACKPGMPRSSNGFNGVELPDPLSMPAATLSDTEGNPFDLRRDTEGYATALFFGYTNCPDICPVHMANLAAVLRDAVPSVRSKVKVVFVTTDPDRDTAERVRKWLNAFDSTFVGLVAPLDEVNRIQGELKLAAAAGTQTSATDSTYEVMHAAQVVMFSRFDGKAHVVYPFGTRQRDWAKDIPRHVNDKW